MIPKEQEKTLLYFYKNKGKYLKEKDFANKRVPFNRDHIISLCGEGYLYLNNKENESFKIIDRGMALAENIKKEKRNSIIAFLGFLFAAASAIFGFIALLK